MHDNQNPSWPEWETVKLIGRGSFGAVYEIQRDMLGVIEKAAMKVISIPQNNADIEELYNDGYDDESITSTFQSHLKSILAEYSLMRKMNGCTNIVNCDDVRYVQHDDGIGWDIFIKMELLQPVTKALSADVSEETVLKLARDMCNALVLCKKNDIIHRDIKPQNIFVSANGDFKLGDFGIAKTVEKTMGGTKIGTYKYMAPEVYNNQPYGSVADIYSLGLVLYWLLNERRMPFLPLPPARINTGMDDEARNLRLSGEPIPPPAHGSEKLKRIVLKACAYDVKDRYASVYEMIADLKEFGIMGFEDISEMDQQKDPTVSVFGSRTQRDTTAVMNEVGTQTDKTVISAEGADTHLSARHKETDKPQRKGVKIGLIAGLVVLLIILLLLLRSCGTGGPVTDPSEDQTGPSSTVQTTEAVYEMTLNTDRLSVFEDTTAILEVSGIPEDARVKWSSSDKSVAKVDSDGEVTGVAEGVATITATWEHNGETHTASAEVTVTTSGVMLDNYKIDDFYVGQTRALSATTVPADGQVDWKSSDTSVATVSTDGVVTAVSGGTAIITVSCGNKSVTCEVTVKSPTIDLDTTETTLYIGESKTVTATAAPGDLTVSWSSDNSEVATVSNGKIQAVHAGSTLIRAKITCNGRTFEDSCVVTVKSPTIDLSTSDVTLYIGESKTVTATVVPSGLTISWSSDNSEVATVSNGKIQAVRAGSTLIRAKITYNGQTFEDSCVVTVKNPTINLNATEVNLCIGESKTVTATVVPSGLSVSWSSDNNKVATVSNGKIQAVGPGSTLIRTKITYNGRTFEDSCVVNVGNPSISVTSSASTITYAEREQDRGTCTLTANVTPDSGSVAWSSDNAAVAQVSGNGLAATVKAISEGSATITATYTVQGRTVKDSCTIKVQKAPSTLKVSNVRYPSKSAVDNFTFNADVSSNYQLTRLFISGRAVSNATGLSVTDSGTFNFASGVYETGAKEAAEITEFLKDKYRAMYDLYVGLAGLLGVDKSLTITIDATFYDSSGNSYSFTIAYILEE